MSQSFQQSRRALGSEAVITLVTDGAREAENLFRAIWETIDRFEQRFSRFDPKSELTALNAQAGSPFAASPEMIQILQACQNYWKDSAGLFNPAILPYLENVGYDRSFEKLEDSPASPSPASSAIPVPLGFENMRIEEARIILPSGMRIDLGGIGKGYLLQQVEDDLKTAVGSYWISLGGDIVVSGYDHDGNPWNIGVQNPHDPENDFTAISSETGKTFSLATSGTFKRRGIKNATPWHHLIDPRTAKPAQTDLIAMTVCGPNPTAADIYASCLCILGSEDSAHFIEQRPSYAAFCFFRDPSQSPMTLGDFTSLTYRHD